MIESLLAVWIWVLALWLTWPALIIATCWSIWICSDDDNKVMSLFATIIISASVFFFFDLSWDYYRWYLVAYIPVGFCWSFFRFDRYGQHIKSNVTSQNERSTRLSLDRNKGKIIHWIVSWPLSVTSWFLRDIIQTLENLITVHLRRVYEKIVAKYI